MDQSVAIFLQWFMGKLAGIKLGRYFFDHENSGRRRAGPRNSCVCFVALEVAALAASASFLDDSKTGFDSRANQEKALIAYD